MLWRTVGVDYDPFRHGRCVASVKDFGSYYQLSVCKFLQTDYDGRVRVRMGRVLSPEDMLPPGADFVDEDGIAWVMTPFSDEPVRLEDISTFGFVEDVLPECLADKMCRRQNNIIRARSQIQQMGNCNDWDYFVTLTFSPEKGDRYNLVDIKQRLKVFINNFNRDYQVKLRYLLIPEQHEDGAWHLHGFLSGLPERAVNKWSGEVKELLRPFSMADTLPYRLLEKLHEGIPIMNWLPYADKFGHCTLEPIQDTPRAVSYIQKYIGKGFGKTDIEANANLYLCSQKLQRAETIKKGFASVLDAKPSFDGEYVTVFQFAKADYDLDTILQFFE